MQVLPINDDFTKNFKKLDFLLDFLNFYDIIITVIVTVIEKVISLMEKRSKQRECLLEDLSGRTDHPTADELYFSVKQKIPNISLGTVYRNLSQLTDSGKILKLTCGGADHFDFNTCQHYHLLCRVCKRLYDLEMPIQTELEQLAQDGYGGKIDRHRLTFYGICENCVKTQN